MGILEILQRWDTFSELQQSVLLQKYPLIKHEVNDRINQIILHRHGKNEVYGKSARRLYNLESIEGIERLHKAYPGHKYLVYEPNGEFITEGRTRMAVESYLNKDRVLVYSA
jgi:hypothetical protein